MKSLAVWTTSMLALGSLLAAHADVPGVREIGRVGPIGKTGMEIQWAGSGFETILDGSKLEAIIDDSGENFLSIEVDGEPYVLDLDPGRFTYTLFHGQPGRHTIRVTRRTSPIAAPTRISLIKSDGKLTAPAAPQRRILVIGDSISAGFGVEGEGPNCEFSYQTQNQGRSYAGLTAKDLGADIQNLSVDGRGLVRNWADAPVPTLQELYKRRLPSAPAEWPAQAYVPDAVVIHVGTNDFAGNRPGETFATAYGKLLGDLRTTYPNVYIYALMGPALSGEEQAASIDAVRNAVATQQATGDARVRFMRFEPAGTTRMWGCQWHPGIESHAAMSTKLEQAIRADLKW
jgi:lysophospholipase L1-like esterase